MAPLKRSVRMLGRWPKLVKIDFPDDVVCIALSINARNPRSPILELLALINGMEI
jgi:hypothetical protein